MTTTTPKVGQPLIWTAAPLAACQISHNAAYCDHVSFRRVSGFGRAEVMTCRGSQTVELSELVAIGATA